MAALNIVSNGLNRIMNAQRVGKKSLTMPTSSLLDNIIRILVEKKYLDSWEKVSVAKKNLVTVYFKYNQNGMGIIREIKRHSSSFRRIYKASHAIPRVKNGFATVIVSTSKGVMTGREARERKIGGEVLCHVF